MPVFRADFPKQRLVRRYGDRWKIKRNNSKIEIYNQLQALQWHGKHSDVVSERSGFFEISPLQQKLQRFSAHVEKSN
ncbi:uncharacterized protein isoform X2 [Rhodnius prolixus]|uniref:uncharacterized protein isoform X2 n=1 Tax=Rhodnius prolixus TaxID=13249 RepID=UPI003D189386